MAVLGAGDGTVADALRCGLRLGHMWNGYANVALWSILLFSNYHFGSWWIPLLQPMVVLVLEIVRCFTGISPWSREQASQQAYNQILWYTKNAHSNGVDLGFNFYDGDYTRTSVQAQLAKFEHVWQLLELKEGMSVLDCGCGFGDWLHWLKTTKNCKVMGINMTKNHAEVVEGRGITCLHTDWQSLFRDKARFAALRHKFDCVTFFDTIEHYRKVSESCVLRGIHGQRINEALGYELIQLSGEITGREYKELFAFAEALIDPHSPCRGIWSSTLHLTTRWHNLRKHGSYLPFPCFEYIMMISIYDGVYPGGLKGLSKWRGPNIELVHEEDRTEDYRMTSILDRNHFGWLRYNVCAPALITSAAALVFHPYAILWHLDMLRAYLGYNSAWMWHIGGCNPKGPKGGICKLLWQVYRVTPPH